MIKVDKGRWGTMKQQVDITFKNIFFSLKDFKTQKKGSIFAAKRAIVLLDGFEIKFYHTLTIQSPI